MTVTRLDRLARSTPELLNILDVLAKRGALFRSLAEHWADTTTPQGQLMLPALGGLAEFERELIRSRTSEGRERAKHRGQHMGRPRALTPDQQQEATKTLAEGTATQADLARRFKVSHSTISRLAGKAAPQRFSPAPPPRKIDAETERAARAFLRRLEGKYPVVDSILFGSRARGDFTAESDADLAVILDGERGDRVATALDMAGIAFDVMLETGVRVQGVPLWPDELARPESFSNPALIKNILREGVHL